MAASYSRKTYKICQLFFWSSFTLIIGHFCPRARAALIYSARKEFGERIREKL